MNDWKEFFALRNGVPVGSLGCDAEALYQAFKARYEQEQREATHPNPDCPARSGPASGCIC